jgi:eukaryotic-like serine/threonine-protein kinase
MADVYLAHDQLLGRDVAVKVLHHHFAEDQEFVERFKREASSAAALSHPNIVGIFDRGEWNGTYYIAMEYVAGRSLKAIVRETGPLEPALAIDTVIQILRAARFAHRRGVIHRDLKPHNVILDEEGRARVTDFGIARAGASDMTLTGSIMGTAQYLSPEQAQGYAVSAASDIYSVGVILYELLTGVVPFEGETAVAIAFKQVSAAPRPPSELNPALPRSLDAVVLRALAKDPIERYADDDELIAALQEERELLPAFAPSPLDGHAVAAPYEPPTGVMLAAPLPYDDRPPEDEDARRRRRRWLWWGLAALVVAGLAVAAVLLLSPAGKVTVPDVAGRSEQSADEILRREGLNPIPQLQPSSTVPAGLVISQDPSAGTRVDNGSHVNLIVSGGPASAPVTDVEGLSEAEAIKKLKKAGFNPHATKEASPTVAAGKVIGTDPPAGTVEQLGARVKVLVSSGPAPVSVPDVTGESLTTAEASLTNAGLALGTVTKKTSSTQSPETVLSQSPAGGTSVKAQSKIDLTVAEAPKEAAVPNVVGESKALASATLQEAGFKIKTVSGQTSEAAQAGMVLRQSPGPGTKAQKGSTVTITVGKLGPETTPTTTTTPTTPAPTPPAAPGP